MRKYAFLLCLVWLPIWAAASGFADESLHYKVDYKWGIINKVAGSVSVNLRNKPDRYACNITGASAKWADKYFMVRDTLRGEILRDGFLPVYYEKMAHEGKDHKYDYVTYHRNGNKVIGETKRKKWEKGKLTRDTTQILEAEGMTLDILTAFYYMRTLPYDKWQKGQKHRVNIFSGKWKEFLTIEYLGEETVEIDKRKYDCWHIKFIFTQKGGTKSSDDMEAWIDRQGNHIPVKMEGKLPVGKVRCFYQAQ